MSVSKRTIGWSVISTLLILVVLSACSTSYQTRSFHKSLRQDWDPVTAAKDWSIVESDSLNIHNAAILFKHGYLDHRKFGEEVIFVYYRLRIFNEKGRDYAKIEIPYFDKFQSVSHVRGRTLLPDGRIIELSPADIREDDVLKGGKLKFKQISFVLPGVEDGCIIEYKYEKKTKGQYVFGARWAFQNELYTRKSELIWDYHDSYGIRADAKLITHKTGIEPTFFNKNHQLDYYAFRFDNLPPLEVPSYSPPAVELPIQAYLHYKFTIDPPSGKKNECLYPIGQWRYYGQNYCESVNTMLKKDTQVRELAKTFQNDAKNAGESARLAYDYIQTNIHNRTYLPMDDTVDDSKLKINETVDDIITNGYGTEFDLTVLFISFLQNMGQEAYLGFVTNRSKALFHEDVMDPAQFDLFLVIWQTYDVGDRLFCPGVPFTAYETLPWYTQGMPVLILRNSLYWLQTPVETPSANQIHFVNTIDLSENPAARCSTRVIGKGQFSAEQKLNYAYLEDDDFQDALQGDILPYVKNVTVDKYTVHDDSLQFKADLIYKVEGYTRETGSRLLINPAHTIKADKNPFEDEEREFLVTFKYPFTRTDNVTIIIPDGYALEELPASFEMENKVGGYNVAYVLNGDQIVFSRTFQLKGSFIYPAIGYPQLIKLFDEIQRVDSQFIVLKRTDLP